MLNVAPITIWLESVTGERWSETVRSFETVADVKRKIYLRKQISPCRQAIIFAGRALPDSAEMRELGVRDGSCLKLHVIARAGPSTSSSNVRDEIHILSDDPSDREHRSRRGCGFSAPEDTSAKESSAGETERENEELPRLHRLTEFGRRRTRSQTKQSSPLEGDVEDFNICNECVDTDVLGADVDEDDENGEKDELVDEQDESQAISEASEVSSGMIICDLTNEFRKLKVRRYRHNGQPPTSRQRTRSKQRGDTREVSSSEDNDSTFNEDVVLAALPSRRGGRPLTVRSSVSGRCNVCAFKLANPFYCRCGKTLCSRHRSAQAHTCGKLRPKMQQVSD